MGNNPRKMLDSEVEELMKLTCFSKDEIDLRYEKFRRDYPHGYMNREQFASVYQQRYKNGDSRKFANHVFRVFDVNKDGKVDFREFLCSLAMTTRGSGEEKLRWAFAIYDVNQDGSITVKEVKSVTRSIQALTNATGDRNMTDGNIQAMFDEADEDCDGRLTLEEFVRATRRCPQFMELLIDYAK